MYSLINFQKMYADYLEFWIFLLATFLCGDSMPHDCFNSIISYPNATVAASVILFLRISIQTQSFFACAARVHLLDYFIPKWFCCCLNHPVSEHFYPNPIFLSHAVWVHIRLFHKGFTQIRLIMRLMLICIPWFGIDQIVDDDNC